MSFIDPIIIPITYAPIDSPCTTISLSKSFAIFSFSSGQILIYDRSMNASTIFDCKSIIFNVYQDQQTNKCYICTQGGVIMLEPRLGKFVQIDKEIFTYYSEKLKIKPKINNNEQQYHFTKNQAYPLYQVMYGEEKLSIPCGGLGSFQDKTIVLISQIDGICQQENKKLSQFSQQNTSTIKDFTVNNNKFVVAFSNGQCEFGQFGEQTQVTSPNLFVNSGFLNDKLYLATSSGVYAGSNLVFDDGSSVLKINGDDEDVFFVSGSADEVGVFKIKL